MKKVPFKSGIHPYEGKSLAKDEKIIEIRDAETMVFPMSQHIGAPAVPVVKIGDRVLMGMKIGEASSFVSSPVYSSVSGKVKMIEDRPMVNGGLSKCIIIENDFLNEADENFGKADNIDELSHDEIVKLISNAGIVGLGGAGFPTGVKLSPKNIDDIDYIIINGAECEPYLTSDYRLMLEKADNIISGVSIVLRIFEKAQAVLAVEDNKPDAIKVLSEKCKGIDRMSVQPLKTRYPQGGERRLIASVTGRKINSHLLPADAGVVVINMATIHSIYDAAALGLPLIHRIVTITGDGANKPGNYDVKLGTPVAHLVEQAGGLKENTVKIISGGPMMGMAMPTLDYPVTKTFSSVLALTSDDVEKMKTTACIRCGRCVSACPENLVPQLMAASVKAEDYERYETLGGMECIECGCCTYVCPAKRPLTQTFKLAKAQIRATKVKK
ncbi:MAG: electron transport complex subunit RsxC [Eubacterium sp.]